MKNFLRLALFMMIISVSIGFSTVNAEKLKINDYANLYTKDEIKKLSTSIEEIIDKYNIDIAIVTTDDVEGKTSREYADDFYDNNGYGFDELNSGLLFLINMEDREVYISTCGYAIDYFTDARINNILDAVYEGLGNEEYYNSTNEFLEEVDYYMAEGKPHNQYRIDENGNRVKAPLTKEEKFKRVIICTFISIVVAAISCLVVVLRYKNPSRGSGESYIDRRSIVFTDKRDDFISSHISKTKINKDNNGGGGSSIHSSSSGTSHGGGGRSF